MTIKEIAKLSGVSAGTVDRVIHNRGKVSEKKRQLVEKVISEHGFSPNFYASNLKLNHGIAIGYLSPILSTEEKYWNDVYCGVRKGLNDFARYGFTLKVFEYDRTIPGSFSIQGEHMLNAGISIAIIVAKCAEEAKCFFSVHKDLRYILIDSDVEGASPLCVIGQNPIRGGQLAARIMDMMIPGEKKLLTFSFRDSYISSERIRGFIEFYNGNTSVDIVNLKFDSAEDIEKALSSGLEELKSFDGIFSPCFAGHIFGEVLNSEYSSHVKVITYDLNRKNIECLRTGKVDCILSQKPIQQGFASIHQIYKSMILKEDVRKFIEMQVDVYFPENIPAEEDMHEMGTPISEEFWIY